MLGKLGAVLVRRRYLVLAGTLAGLIAAAALGGDVASRLSAGGFQDDAAESEVAARQLDEVFGAGSPNLILLVTAEGGSVDAPAVAAEGAALTAELADEGGVRDVVSYWTLGGAPPLRSADGAQALVLARIVGTDDEIDEIASALSPRFTRDGAVIDVGVGGEAELFRDISHTVEADLVRAETIAIPVTLVLLVLVFGSVVAALLPLAVGVVAIMGTFLILTLLTGVTEVSIFALNLTTVMGLGLGIDYSLFIVSRFREELAAGRDVPAAVRRTVETAGRTVLFSAATVAISLAALAVFPLVFLRSFAYAGIAVVALAAVAAVVTLPALLAVLGPRVDSLRLFGRRQKPVGEGWWHRMAMTVMRRPLPIATAVVALLVFLGAPFFGIEFGLSDDRALPEDSAARQVHEALRANFASSESSALSVVAAGAGDPASIAGDLDAYAAQLSAVEGVARVDALTGAYASGVKAVEAGPESARFAGRSGTWLSVVPAVEPMSAEGEALVSDLRAVEAPFDVGITGPSASLVDAKASLFSRVPLAVGLIAVATFLLLFAMFGSLVVPVKAVVLNLLSLSATFGAMVWIFQDGNLSGLLNFTPTGTIDLTSPIMMFCIAFGLSMDYEVFLLSRIKEEYDRTGDNERSVAIGLERTGRIVTAAALLLAMVFLAFATSGISFMKLIGLGLALAVLMDASLVRATLVPAFMRLAGAANWWAPAPLRRLHQRFGISESTPDTEVALPELAGSGQI
ncbi:MAG TPA: MMPL family transporter [Egibacteraceae bacterium]|nr:MMPL family transporter [Egibacteraceae bacterium]